MLSGHTWALKTVICCPLLMGFLVLLPLSGMAEKPTGQRITPTMKNEARRRAGLANELYKAGKYGEALLAYQAAFDLVPSPALLYNIGLAYEKLRNFEQAILAFEKYLDMSPAASDRDFVKRRIDGLMKRVTLVIDVTSYPAGAALRLEAGESEIVGRTPAKLQLPPGKHAVYAELKGFVSAQQTIHVRLGQSNFVDFQLLRLSTLKVEADIEGATLFLDGDAAEHSYTLPFREELMPGRHRIKVVRQGYDTLLRELNLTPGENLSMVLNLSSRKTSADLNVKADVNTANCFVDGRPVGTVPLAQIPIRPGKRTLTLKRSGFDPWEYELDVESGFKYDFSVHLREQRSDAELIALWGSVGVAGITLAIGTVFAVMAIRDENLYSEAPHPDLKRRGEDNAMKADIFFGIGALSGVTALIIYLVTEDGQTRGKKIITAPESRAIPNRM